MLFSLTHRIRSNEQQEMLPCRSNSHGTIELGFCGILIVCLSLFHSCSFLFSLVGIYLNLRCINCCGMMRWGEMLRVGKMLICILCFRCIRSNGSEYNIIIVYVLLFFQLSDGEMTADK